MRIAVAKDVLERATLHIMSNRLNKSKREIFAMRDALIIIAHAISMIDWEIAH